MASECKDKSVLSGAKLPCRQGRLSFWKQVLLACVVGSFASYQLLARFYNNRCTTYEHSAQRRPGSTEIDDLFLTVPNPKHARLASKLYSNHPHLAGSKEDFSDAKVILKLFQKEFGIDSHDTLPLYKSGSKESRWATIGLSSHGTSSKPSSWVDIYYPYMNTPLDRSLEILDDEGIQIWQADLVEEADPLDEDAFKYQDAVPTWHGLSRNGTAVGQLVYANYGTHEDYESLKQAGVDLSGKIVIVRYGQLFRGLKVKGAEELGAIAVLIYTDPRDDGYVTVANGYVPYPHGPARAPASVQRGSVQYLSMYPGDPTTEGYPSYEDAVRHEGRNIPKIPSLPISWKNAERLLEEIGETGEVDENGKVRLNGRSSVRQVKLVNHVDDRVIPIYNTMAAIPGHIRDEVVLIGAHRDAWVLGAADPISGTVALHEVIRGFGTLLRSGWKPLRTILFASWDAEEYGLIGSTEYGEDFADWLKKHVVSYINVDVASVGSRWNAQASPSLANLVRSLAHQVPHPTDSDLTLWDARLDTGTLPPRQDADDDEDFVHVVNQQVMERYNASLVQEVAPLGSGSDYSTFLQHLGIASTDEGFAFTPFEAPYHYHSIYDSHHWQELYGDPTFTRHVAVAKHLGLMALHLSENFILPLNTTHYSLELYTYLNKVKQSSTDFSIDFSPLESAISKVYSASIALDSEKATAEEEFIKILDRIENTMHDCRQIFGKDCNHWQELLDLQVNTRVLQMLQDQDNTTSFPKNPIDIIRFILAARRVTRANKKLKSFEEGFISEEGIKDRQWYKHLGVAPGKWLGYGASTFPALTESIVYDKDPVLAQKQVQRLASLLSALATRIHP